MPPLEGILDLEWVTCTGKAFDNLRKIQVGQTRRNTSGSHWMRKRRLGLESLGVSAGMIVKAT